ncbi:cold sensitive U2 snRNA suppressor 1 [[Candida] railenensis]|uniref:Cold sensitive U2 snRNA suppressor 1 n=1 Tax=[Candida] railenensis TaxID=45579 RepID=A0A9P0QNR3_9ASCO|nr:cold sensitive U2 snRNA suppressor 1 [[Candida] railenensis]
MSKIRKSKNQQRRERAKLKKKEVNGNEIGNNSEQANPIDETVESEIPEVAVIDKESTKQIDENDDVLFAQFQNVFQKFENKEEHQEGQTEESNPKGDLLTEEADDDSSSASSSDEEEEENQPLSKRQLRKLNKVSLAELKSSTSRPQLVEWFDVDSHDPFLHVALKSQLNCVPIPPHWTNKRDYLSGRKGVERVPFQLPKFILDTGIQDMRNTDAENESTLRQSQRDRVQPKMGKLDIDYQKLHDAFFKFQTKPKLYAFGDLFYEGRESHDEYSTEVGVIRPGIVSKDLRRALGMHEDDPKIPPPWLQVMAKIGKPPAYKDLYIPGLDMEYNNEGYTHSKEKSKSTVGNVVELFGQITSDIEEESEEEGTDDSENEGEKEEAADQPDYEPESEPESEGDHTQKTSISEFGGTKASSKPKGISSTENKPLYQILQENDKASNSPLTNKGYDVSIEATPSTNNKRPAAETNTNEKKKFKF